MRARYGLLTAQDLARLPSPCPSCPLPLPTSGAAWVSGAVREHGFVGAGAWLDDACLGYVLVASGAHLPGRHPRAGLDPRGAVLMRTHVAPAHQGQGIGTALVQHVTGRLPSSHLDALSTRPATCTTPPAAWLGACGFVPVSASPAHEVWRLDLASTLRLPELGGRALRRLRGYLPRPTIVPPEPASRS